MTQIILFQIWMKIFLTSDNRSVLAYSAGVASGIALAGIAASRRRLRRPRRHAARLARPISIAGVTTRVRTVAKPRPKTMAVDRWIHHCVEGAPMSIER